MRPHLRSALVALAMAGLLSPSLPIPKAEASEPTWQMIGLPSTAYPIPIYDAARRRMLLIGTDYTDSSFTVWSTSLDSTQGWSPLPTHGLAPHHSLFSGYLSPWGGVFDARHDRVIVWSGNTYAYVYGTWALSLETMQWTQLTTTVPSTSFHFGQGATYDPVGDRVLVIGGVYYSGLGTPSATNAVSQLNLSGTPTWTSLVPSGTLPTGRGYVSTIFDAARNRVLMFGGDYVSTHYPYDLLPMDETWELSLSGTPAWRFLPPVAPVPSARNSAIAVYDSLQDRMLMFGGSGVTDPHALWSLSLGDPDTARWSLLGTIASWPRATDAWILDPLRNVLVTGGDVVAGSGTVSLGGRFELSLGGAPTWSTVVPDRSGPAWGGRALHDRSRGRLISVAPDPNAQQNLAVWATHLAQPPDWSRLSYTASARSNASFIVDPLRDRLVMFGGYVSGTYLNTVATMPLAGGSWTPLSAGGSPPAGRFHAATAYDSVGDRMIVYGGNILSAQARRICFGDVWALTLGDNPTWSQLPIVGTVPRAREVASYAFGGVGRHLLIYGGTDTLGTINDFWSLSLDSLTWSPKSPSGTGPGSSATLIAVDDARQRALFTIPGTYPSSTNDLFAWEVPLTGDLVWSQLATANTGPAGIGDFGGFYDRSRDGLVLYRRESSGESYDARAQQIWTLFPHDHPTPIEIALASATFDASGVTVRWWTAGSGSRLAVERQVNGGGWTTAARVLPDGTGYVVYHDTDVAPGQLLEYRLRIEDGTAVRYAGLASVRVPGGAVVFAAAKNPAAVARFRVALPAGTREARVELFDTSGRRVRSSRVGAVRGETTLVDLGAPGSLAPGVYQARLVADGKTLGGARLVILR